MKVLLLLCAFSTSIAFGQAIGNDYIWTPAQIGIDVKEVPIEGSQYVNEIYKKGEIFINGKSQSVALMRYDALNEAIEILDQNQRPRKLLRRKNIAAYFDGTFYVVVEFKEGNKIKSGYLNPLNDGETVLYYRPMKIFIQAKQAESGYEPYQPPIIMDVSSYYIKTGDQPAEPINLRKNQVLKKLEGKSSLLKKFIAEHNLNLKKQVDVLRLLGYYNTIRSTSKSQTFEGATGIGG